MGKAVTLPVLPGMSFAIPAQFGTCERAGIHSTSGQNIASVQGFGPLPRLKSPASAATRPPHQSCTPRHAAVSMAGSIDKLFKIAGKATWWRIVADRAEQGLYHFGRPNTLGACLRRCPFDFSPHASCCETHTQQALSIWNAAVLGGTRT